jgi:hypothetical protein
LGVPKGKGAGITRAPGQQAKAKYQPIKVKDQPAPVVPTVVPVPDSEDVAQPEKHPEKSGKGY